jgi:opacity protein-like surface antigen
VRRLGLGLAACLALASPASAQSAPGIVANLGVSAATIDGGTHAAVSGGIGYRLSSVMTLAAEVTWVPSLTPDAPQLPPELTKPPLVLPAVSFDEAGGHAAIFTTNVRLELPRHGRLLPYVIGGGGVGSVREHFRETISFSPIPVPVGAGGIVAFPQLLPASIVQTVSTTSTDLALTIGGGVSVFSREHLTVDVEGRYLGLFGDRTLHVGRFGAGVSYRF